MRRPLILIGRGGLAAACLDAAADLSNVLGAPTATTVLAKGALGSHPHNIGLFGSLATDAGINAISAADGVIAIGASLNEYTTDHGALLDGKRVVQVDDDLAAFGRYVDVDAQVHADAGEVVPIICRALREAGHASSGFAARNHSRGMTAENSSVPRRVFDAIEAALPADHYLVFGAGRLAVQAMGALNTSAPGAITHTMNFGSIGLATATAIGASIAAPHRRTFAVVGDGGFVLGGLVELTSAVRQDASLTVLLLNDNCYGAEQVQLQNRGLDSTLSLMPWPELAEVARALGCAAIRVDAAGDLLPLVDAVRTTRRGPLLIEIAFDPFTIPSRR